MHVLVYTEGVPKNDKDKLLTAFSGCLSPGDVTEIG